MLNEIINEEYLKGVKHEFIADNTIIIYDFISNEELETWKSIINENSLKWESVFSGEEKKAICSYIVTHEYDIAHNITKRLQSILKDQTLTATGFYNIYKYEINDGMPEHIDYNDYFGNLIYGAILYLNEEYSGGEIRYTKYNKDVKPLSKSLIIHTSDNPHLVKPVISGTRYSMPVFVWKNIQELFDDNAK